MKPGDFVRGKHPYHNTSMVLHPDDDGEYGTIGYVRAGEFAVVVDVLRCDDAYCDYMKVINTHGIIGWIPENQLVVVE